MAEIHVQTKKNNTSSMWIWIVIAVLIIAAVVYMLTRNKDTNDNTTVTHDNTSYIQAPQPVMSHPVVLAQAA